MTQKFRRALRALAIAAAAIAVLGRPVAGQSLADIAKKEEERRKAVKSAAPAKTAKDNDKTQKTLTNKNLVPSEPGTPPPSPSPAQPAPAAEGQAPSHTHAAEDKAHAAAPQTPNAAQAPATSDAGAAKDEKYWRGRMVTARGNLQRQELFLEALQSRVNALTTDFVNRDDPAQRAQIAADRQKALAEMEAVRKDIEQAKKQIADLEEEARKAAVPPGWLR
jgi:hypothetical protein